MASASPSASGAAPRKKSRTVLYVVIGAVLVVGLGAGAFLKSRNSQKGTPVTTDKAVVKTITQIVSATGKIQPEVEVKISPEVAGEIIELPLREGAAVKKGELLVRIKPDNYRYQVDQREADLAATRATSLDAKAKLLQAQEDFKRSDDLYNRKLISDSEYLAARTALDGAQASYDNSLAQIRRAEGLLKQSQDQLEKTTIYAPMDGTISSLTSEVGERVVATGQFSGTEVMRVANLADMEVRVNVNENDVVNVKIGDQARISIDAYPGRRFTGLVKEIASAAKTTGANTQEEVTNFEVRVRISDKDVSLRPGMSANADIETQTVADVVAVPIQSVTVRSRQGSKTIEQLAADRDRQARETKGEGAAAAVNEKQQRERERADREALQRVVFVYNGDTVKMVPVETGIADTTHMEIKSGIQEGDEIVSGSFSVITRTLKDGMKVRLDKPKIAAEKK
ncbi:MAG TPA: efflux RND transporter periplasmic adaptor subunit [Opitutaceae bacterium]